MDEGCKKAHLSAKVFTLWGCVTERKEGFMPDAWRGLMHVRV